MKGVLILLLQNFDFNKLSATEGSWQAETLLASGMFTTQYMSSDYVSLLL